MVLCEGARPGMEAITPQLRWYAGRARSSSGQPDPSCADLCVSSEGGRTKI